MGTREFVTPEAARERFRELSDQVAAAHAEMRALSSDGVGNAFRVEMAERWETQERTNRALMYRMFGEIADPPDESAMVPAMANSLARRLHPPELPPARLPLRGPPQPGLDTPGATDADKLFFACGPDHKRVTDGHYHTSVTDTRRLAWTDGTTPPDINHAHHPEELLLGNTDPPLNDEK